LKLKAKKPAKEKERKMIDFLEVCARAESGPLMNEKDFDFKLFLPELQRIQKEFDIVYPSGGFINCDDELADRIFLAAKEFLVSVGTYCMDSNRVIKVDHGEIDRILAGPSDRCVFGEGKDQHVFTTRKPDDATLPDCHVNYGTIHSSEQLAVDTMSANVSFPEARAISISTVTSIRGQEIRSGSPLEVYAGIKAINLARQACARAGRPGMAIINHVPATANPVATIASSAPQFGGRPSDGWLIGILAEHKIDYGSMSKIAYLQNWGANIGSQGAPSLGGYCGDAAGTAIVNTAYFLMGMVLFGANYHLCFPIHFQKSCCSTRDVLWCVSASAAAAARNLNFPVSWRAYLASGCNTKSFFHEACAWLLAAVTSGAAAVKMPTPAAAVKLDASTPMETRFGIAMTKAASKLSRSQAHDIMANLLEKYEPLLNNPPLGDTGPECYNFSTGKPSAEYQRLYDDTICELQEMGIPLT